MDQTGQNTVEPGQNGKLEFLRLQRDIHPGTILENVYEVREFVDFGGMGYLFKGYHRRLKRDIAIKVLKGRWLISKEKREEFFEEGHQMAQIQHQYVARIYDVGEYKKHCYLVMDFIPGLNLYHYIKEKGRPNPEYAVDMMTKLAEALTVVHQQGIIHRDIKPTNIMINEKGDPILLDFGIARSSNSYGSRDKENNHPGFVTGTPEFIAPECYEEGYKLTYAADVFSLGKTFAFILADCLVQEDDGNHESANYNPSSPKSSGKLGRLVESMIDEDPEKRLANARAVLGALQKIKGNSNSKLRRMITILIIAFLAILSLFFLRDSKKTHSWDPKPRVIAVIPTNSTLSYLAYEFEDILQAKYPFYQIVDRRHIDKTIGELQLEKDGWISKSESKKIGKMVGAQNFVMFESGASDGTAPVYPRAYDVETTVLVGNSRITPEIVQLSKANPQHLQVPVDRLIEAMEGKLPFRTEIAVKEGDQLILKHGGLFGARVGMEVRILDSDQATVGLAKVIKTERDFATAMVLNGKDQMRKGMRVEEIIKDDPKRK